MRLRGFTHAVALVLSATAAHAADWVVGLGTTEFSRDGASDAAIATLELHATPRARAGPFNIALAAGIEVDAEGDYWIGAGVSARAPIRNSRWVFELSLMPGFYDDAIAENDLGGNLQFRSLVGLGFRLDNGSVVSIAASHKSNAGLSGENPGANAIMLRFGRPF